MGNEFIFMFVLLFYGVGWGWSGGQERTRKFIRVEWVEFQLIWSRETRETLPNTLGSRRPGASAFWFPNKCVFSFEMQTSSGLTLQAPPTLFLFHQTTAPFCFEMQTTLGSPS